MNWIEWDKWLPLATGIMNSNEVNAFLDRHKEVPELSTIILWTLWWTMSALSLLEGKFGENSPECNKLAEFIEKRTREILDKKIK